MRGRQQSRTHLHVSSPRCEAKASVKRWRAPSGPVCAAAPCASVASGAARGCATHESRIFHRCLPIRLSIAGWSGRGPSLTPYVTFTPCRLDLTRGFAMVRGWCAFLDQFWHTHPGGWGGAGGACKGALSCGWGVRWVRWVRRAVGV